MVEKGGDDTSCHIQTCKTCTGRRKHCGVGTTNTSRGGRVAHRPLLPTSRGDSRRALPDHLVLPDQGQELGPARVTQLLALDVQVHGDR